MSGSGSDSETIRTASSPTEACFAENHWSVVLSAVDKQHQPKASKALDRLCTLYWLPLYAYLRRTGKSPNAARGLTQRYFARFLEKDYLAAADPSNGLFEA
jgi:RNA polymerase sigma-70 factor (ECF subfamily)